MLIDITRLLSRFLENRLATGVDRVSLAYVEHFQRSAHAVIRFAGRWVELDDRDSQRVFEALLHPDAKSAWLIRSIVGPAYLFSWPTQRGKLFFNTGHSGLDCLSYVHELNNRKLRPLFFLHDLIPISHPEYCRAGEADKHHRRLDAMLSHGCGLIVNSRATRDDLLAYAEERELAVPPCVVAHLAPANLPLDNCYGRPLESPYFVVLGTIEPRKNHLMLLHLWRQLIAEFGDSAPRLVVIGQRGWECEQIVDLLDRCQALQGFVIEQSCCTDIELVNWLKHAEALLFPSFVEGYGIPLMEALMLGLPVIASDLSVFHEIAGEIPEYLDPLDGPGWKRMVMAYVNPKDVSRLAQLERIKIFEAPTWKQHFTVVDEFLVEITKGRFNRVS
jgi:glycosyltransferase involved in cell wall biosynthesis